MEPIEGAVHTLDKAAQWGPEIFIAVLILLMAGAFLYVFGRQMFTVIDNNTRALAGVSAMVERTCSEVQEHERSTAVARQGVHDNGIILTRIDTCTGLIADRTKDIEAKVTTLVARAEK